MKKILLVLAVLLIVVCGVVAYMANTYVLPFVFSSDLAYMIRVGQYDYIDDSILSVDMEVNLDNFKTDGIILNGLKRPTNTNEILANLKRNNARPAKVEELLAYGAENPAEQFVYPIFALGSVWTDSSGRRFVFGLDSVDERRGIILMPFDRDWSERCIFLVVKN